MVFYAQRPRLLLYVWLSPTSLSSESSLFSQKMAKTFYCSGGELPTSSHVLLARTQPHSIVKLCAQEEKEMGFDELIAPPATCV